MSVLRVLLASVHPGSLPALLPGLLAFIAVLIPASVCAAPEAPAPDTVYDVPRVDGITIDGNIADWADRGFRIDAFRLLGWEVPAAGHFNPTARLAWDDRGLLVVAKVDQDTAREEPDPTRLWAKDSMEVFVSTGKGQADLFQLVITPGMDRQSPISRHIFYDMRQSAGLMKVPLSAEIATARTADGYVVEALLPWASLGLKPARDRSLGFQMYFNKFDGSNRSWKAIWYPETGPQWFHDRVMTLKLSDKPSPPIVSAAFGGYDGDASAVVNVIGAASIAGQRVVVRDGRRQVASGTLAGETGRSAAVLDFPMPPYGATCGPLDVSLDGKPMATLILPDATSVRRQAFQDAEYRFDRYVFSEEDFPSGQFVRPERLLVQTGPYTVSTTFYDAEFNPVDQALKAGRYGAIVTVKNTHGDVAEHRFTFYRTPQPMNIRDSKSASIRLPESSGVDPAIADEQPDQVDLLVKQALARSFQTDDGSARLLAGLHEIGPGRQPVTMLDDARALNSRWWYRLDRSLGRGKLPVIVRTPRDYDTDKARQWPLIVFLHGSGERGSDLKAVRSGGPSHMIDSDPGFGFITAVPQCPEDSTWIPEQVKDLVDDICARYRVDRDRICLTGYSMGGYGSWATALTYPDMFAAIVPIAGGADTRVAYLLKGVNTWIFHGIKDDAVNVSKGQEMYDALEKAGGHVRLTLFANNGHDIWGPVYMRKDLYEWMAAQRRGQADMPTSTETIEEQVR